MRDYWKELKLNECWSAKARYNKIMELVLEGQGASGTTQQLIVEDEEDLSTIHVTVVDDDTGDGINNANVQIQDAENHTHESSTGTAGGCNISDVPFGECTVLVEADGYEANSEELLVDSEDMNITIRLTSTVTDENIGDLD